MVLGDAAVVVGAVRFWLNGASTYRNSDRIVHLYDYLLAGARRTRGQATAVQLVADDATFEDGLVGPLRLETTDDAALAVSQGVIVDADGIELTGTVQAGVEFYIRPRPGADGVLLTATVPASSNGTGGRVVTGVARDDVNSRLTPVALAAPSPLVVDFAIYVEARAAAVG